MSTVILNPGRRRVRAGPGRVAPDSPNRDARHERRGGNHRKRLLAAAGEGPSRPELRDRPISAVGAALLSSQARRQPPRALLLRAGRRAVAYLSSMPYFILSDDMKSHLRGISAQPAF